MPTEARINIPFIPQEGITSQILSAIQLANEQHARQQQLALQGGQLGLEQQRLGLQQEAMPSEIAQREAATQASTAQAGEAAARAKLLGAQAGMTPVVMSNGQTMYLPAKEASAILAAREHATGIEEAAKTKAGAAVDIANIHAAVAREKNEIDKALGEGRLSILGLNAKAAIIRAQAAQGNVESLNKYRIAAADALQETAAARDQAAKTGNIKALTDASQRFSALANIASAFDFNEVGEEAQNQLKQTLAVPTKPKATALPPGWK